MRLMPLRFFAALALVSLLAAPSPASGQNPSEEEARREMEQARAARWAKARDQVLVAPRYVTGQGASTSLILVNRFAEPLDISLTAHSPEGTIHPLPPEHLEARETTEIDLGQILQDAPAGYASGSLRVSYFGDAEMLQAWVVLSGPKGSLELPLAKSNYSSATTWRSFWDARPYHPGEQVEPSFHFHNASATVVVVDLSARALSGPSDLRRLRLQPGASAVLKPKSHGRWAAGSVEIKHDGHPGQVAVIGLLEGRRLLAALPMATAGDLDATAFDSLTLPMDLAQNAARPSSSVLSLSLFNPESDVPPASVRVSLVAPSGATLVELSQSVEAHTIESIDLAASVLGRPLDGERLRLELSVERGKILPFALAVDEHGTAVDIALTPRSKAHDSGTYPLPSLLTHDATTVFLNVGAEPAEILAHVEWQGGAYSVPAFTIPPSATHAVHFNALVEEGVPDRLGRVFIGDHPRAFLQWLSRDGSDSLLARTEVRRKGETDRVGFSCFGCCEEVPYGALIPDEIAFDIGQTPSLDPVIYYSTCSGTLGPYGTSPDTLTYSAPLSWNGEIISSSGYTTQDVSFSERITYTWVDCNQRTKTVRGIGPVAVDTCMKEHGLPFDEAKSCAEQTTSCFSCYGCCEKLKQVGYCRCDKQPFGRVACREGIRNACGTCKQNCFGTHYDTCEQQHTTCPI